MNVTAILYAVALLGGLGILFGLMLSFADKQFHVEVDERVQRVREAVAGANCGACGYPGCDQFAAAVVRGEAPVNGCTPGGIKSAKAVGAIMGQQVADELPQVARVLCQGEQGISADRYEYTGYPSCQAASQMAGGPKKCTFACLGLADCQRACKFDAIRMVNGLSVIDPEKCTACGSCVKVCPRGIIRLLPRASNVIVRCQNTDGAREARENCLRACIACKRCEKACAYDAIHVENNCARIDPKKCTLCGACVKVCPTHAITEGDLVNVNRE